MHAYANFNSQLFPVKVKNYSFVKNEPHCEYNEDQGSNIIVWHYTLKCEQK